MVVVVENVTPIVLAGDVRTGIVGSVSTGGLAVVVRTGYTREAAVYVFCQLIGAKDGC